MDVLKTTMKYAHDVKRRARHTPFQQMNPVLFAPSTLAFVVIRRCLCRVGGAGAALALAVAVGRGCHGHGHGGILRAAGAAGLALDPFDARVENGESANDNLPPPSRGRTAQPRERGECMVTKGRWKSAADIQGRGAQAPEKRGLVWAWWGIGRACCHLGNGAGAGERWESRLRRAGASVTLATNTAKPRTQKPA